MAEVTAQQGAGTAVRVAAVDLGATSGRVMSGRISASGIEINQMHRFPNGAVRVGSSYFWDVLGIHREVLTGIREVARSGPLHGIGIDSWAVDYGLLDRDGQLLGNPFSHRDPRTDGLAAKVAAEVGAAELYACTGIQQLPFNTIYQLAAARGTAALEAAETLLLLPDLLGYWLTGSIGAERTNASTTQLYDARSGEWATEIARRLGIPWGILPPLRDPGSMVGPLLPHVAQELGLTADVPVVAVGSHDTASAVVAVPAETGRFAYISSGTWSLVGLELDQPVLTEAARLADFTNELGVDGTTRFLKNVMGLWVLSESLRSWSDRRFRDVELRSLITQAGEFDPQRTVIDINDPRLLVPSSAADPMPERIAALAAEAGEPVPHSPVAITRCIIDSLAVAYRRQVRTAAELADVPVEVVHVVGGGSQNEILCQLTADACGLPVLAGPVEAAALGNVLVQGRALGADLPDLAAMRALVRRSYEVRRYEPRDSVDWAVVESRVF
ncbi:MULTISPECIES: rhamnulokinase [Nocardioides]|uniref:Rhamnulokinase family protein n=1 Tax=Nocardioides vastitatis TaxID=2568655 RepID=A0ABW0ZJ73_9ACTN|nr:rhamnulokinase family protein [Nocardioides sp.]THJ04808.1 rhamnulokinase [Nocardioides sp.]